MPLVLQKGQRRQQQLTIRTSSSSCGHSSTAEIDRARTGMHCTMQSSTVMSRYAECHHFFDATAINS